ARFASKRRDTAAASGDAAMVVLRVAGAIVALAIAAARCDTGSGHDRYRMPELSPVHVPAIDLPKHDLPGVDLDQLRRSIEQISVPKPVPEPPPLETP